MTADSVFLGDSESFHAFFTTAPGGSELVWQCLTHGGVFKEVKDGVRHHRFRWGRCHWQEQYMLDPQFTWTAKQTGFVPFDWNRYQFGPFPDLEP